MTNSDLSKVTELADIGARLIENKAALSGEELEKAVQQWSATSQTLVRSLGHSGKLEQLQMAFDLSNEELALLCLLLLPYLDARYLDYFSKLQEDPNRVDPAASLLADLMTVSFDEKSALLKRLTANSPLITWRLILPADSLNMPTSGIRAHFPLVPGPELLSFFSANDATLHLPSGLLFPVKADVLPSCVPIQPMADAGVAVLIGGFSEQLEAQANSIAEQVLHQPLFALNNQVFEVQPNREEALRRVLSSLSMEHAALYWADGLEALDKSPSLIRMIQAWIKQPEQVLIFGSAELRPLPSGLDPKAVRVWPVGELSFEQQQRMLSSLGQQFLPGNRIDWEAINQRYSFNYERTVETLTWARNTHAEPHKVDTETYQQSILETSPNALIPLAERLHDPVSFKNLVLDPATLESLRNSIKGYSLQSSGHPGDPGGACVLLQGPTGSGRRRAAEALTSALQLPAYRINTTALLNEGRSEKGLIDRLFERATENSAALLFFGMDFWPGMPVNTGIRARLLEHIDRYRGLTVVTRLAPLPSYKFIRAVQKVDFPEFSVSQRVLLFRKLAFDQHVRLAPNINLPGVMMKSNLSARGVERVFFRARSLAKPPATPQDSVVITAASFAEALRQESL